MNETPICIGIKRVREKPKDFPNKIIFDSIAVYTGDVFEFATNEQRYFTFGFRIKRIKK